MCTVELRILIENSSARVVPHEYQVPSSNPNVIGLLSNCFPKTFLLSTAWDFAIKSIKKLEKEGSIGSLRYIFRTWLVPWLASIGNRFWLIEINDLKDKARGRGRSWGGRRIGGTRAMRGMCLECAEFDCHSPRCRTRWAVSRDRYALLSRTCVPCVVDANWQRGCAATRASYLAATNPRGLALWAEERRGSERSPLGGQDEFWDEMFRWLLVLDFLVFQ